MRFFGSLIGLLALTAPALAMPAVDFEDWAGGDGDQTSANSRAFNFATTNGTFYISGPGNQYLTSRSGSLTMTKVGGGTFSVGSLDLREGIGNATHSVTFTGINIGVVGKQTFSLDGADTTWDSFTLNGFNELAILLVEPYGSANNFGTSFYLDNIVTPEPSAAMLLAFSIVLASWKC